MCPSTAWIQPSLSHLDSLVSQSFNQGAGDAWSDETTGGNDSRPLLPSVRRLRKRRLISQNPKHYRYSECHLDRLSNTYARHQWSCLPGCLYTAANGQKLRFLWLGKCFASCWIRLQLVGSHRGLKSGVQCWHLNADQIKLTRIPERPPAFFL